MTIASITEPIYQFTAHSFVCNVDLNVPLPSTQLRVTTKWSINNEVIVNDDRINASNPSTLLNLPVTSTNSILTFFPINSSDTGQYVCTAIVSVNDGDPFVEDGENYDVANVTVQGINRHCW